MSHLHAEEGESTLPTPGQVKFDRDVRPILTRSCFECHSRGSRKGGLQMETRQALLKGSKHGPVVVVGRSDQSKLIQRVSPATALEDRMPPEDKTPLTVKEIKILSNWIDQGLEWEQEPATSHKKPRQLERPSLPPGRGNPVDLLLVPYFKKHGLRPPGSVDDRLYMRRVYLDTVGLLPPVSELKSFVQDDGPDKRERLVSRLLGRSDDYASHWMTFWSDHLRNGTVVEVDISSKDITPWLLGSLRTNKPYDRFVRELVVSSAGTEGFAAGKGTSAKEGLSASQRQSMQMAFNVSQVFLGIQLKCAACHDSRINEWTLKDAYGLASIFEGAPLELVECEKPTGAHAVPGFLFPDVGAGDPRLDTLTGKERLADLMTHQDNGRFPRTIVNRIWARFMGRGIVEPVDSMDQTPWHRELLDWLATDLVENGYDLKRTMHLILASKAYQLPAVDRADADEAFVFRGPGVRRMTAEQFVDAVGILTGNRNQRAWQMKNSDLTKSLGRPNRLVVVTSRNQSPSTMQALDLLNGNHLQELVHDDGLLRTTQTVTELDAILHANEKSSLVRLFFWRALGREPTAREIRLAEQLLGPSPGQEGFADLIWILVNLPEFQLIF